MPGPGQTPDAGRLEYRCLICKDAGWLVDRADPRNPRLVPCNAAGCPTRFAIDQQHYSNLFSQAAIPTLYSRASLTDMDAWLQDEVRLAEDEGRGLFLHGPSGVGKTHMGVAILRQRMDANVSVLFTTLADLLDAVKSTYGEQNRATVREIDLLRAVQEVGCLLLDDLSASLPSDWSVIKTFQVTNARAQWKRETIYTSNYGPDALEQSWGDVGISIMSRIAGTCRIVRMDGKDRRLERPAEEVHAQT